MAKGMTQHVQVRGLKEALSACNKLGPDANRELRKAAQGIARDTMQAARARAEGMGGVHRIAADSLRAKLDRVPSITGGGSKRVGAHRHPAGGVFFGAEFGGGARPTTHQFPPHRGQRGYFFWPTIRARESHDLAAYQRALDDVCRKWAT